MQSLNALIQAHASERPDSPAIAGPDGTAMSYPELARHMEGIAATLRRRGVGAADRVALVLPDGPAMATAFVAVASCCVCAPLNPAYSARDFAFYLDDLGAAGVIVPAGAESAVLAVAAERHIPVWRLQRDAPMRFQLADCATRQNPSPDPLSNGAGAVALILHTSGTTSRPKMVPLTHANLLTSAANVAATLRLAPEDRGLVIMPLFHIHGLVGALLSSLHAGATAICAQGFDAAECLRIARDQGASWYSAVPTMHQALLAHAHAHPESAEGVRLRLVRSSSASLPPKVFHDLEERWSAPVVESYGMTEAAHQMTSNPLPPATRKPGSVGLAAGPEVAVVDPAGQPLPPGQTGPIVIRGANVTPGYARNPEANREAFRDGWFHTGDLGYFDAEGYLFLTGRLKEMINRGGENIAPREIDEALLEHPAVAQATAFAVPHASLGEDLAAAVVLRPGQPAGEALLRGFLAERLAPFKVPSRIVFVDAIPKGPTGKLQRIGLHEKLAAYLESDYIAPRTETEREMARLFGEVLGRERVGVHDNFFFHGGDSLRATRVLAAVRRSHPAEYPVTLVFQHPTPEQLAAAVDQLSQTGTAEVDALVDELSGLSPGELERLLADLDGRE
jgi:acyl-CoA synthetase (AMP-forming)/AMP-acid ligase II